MKTRPLLLGITGAFGSGKTTASSFFEDKGFELITLSSFLEKELKKTSPDLVTRKALQDYGNFLRKKYGPGILAEKALKAVANGESEHVVIDGIRNSGEIAVLGKHPNFVLVAIVSDRDIRYARLKETPRREALTWKVFEGLDYRDLGLGESDTGLQTGLCISLADKFIVNNGTREAFAIQLETVLQNK